MCVVSVPSQKRSKFDGFATRNTSEATAVHLVQIRKPAGDVNGIFRGFSPSFGHFWLPLSTFYM